MLFVRRRIRVNRTEARRIAHFFDCAGNQLKRAWRPAAAEQPLLWLFIGGLAWTPYWYGGNDWLPWGVNAIIFPGLTALYELSLLLRGKRHAVSVGYLALPVAFFAIVIFWIEFQTVTWLPSTLINPIWHMAGDALGRSVAESISVDRDLTVLGLMHLITAGTVFWLSLQLCRDKDRADRLIASIGTITALYSIYGLAALKFGPLPWLSYIDPRNSAVSATFINPDSFATYAAIGLVVNAALIVRYYGSAMQLAAGNRSLQLAYFIERTGGKGALLLGAGFVVLVALLLTRSRGGVFAAALGLFVVASLGRQWRKYEKAPRLLLAIGAVIVIVTSLTFGGPVGVKLESGGVYDESRFLVYQLTLRSILNEPLLGYGYGTFPDVFPMYRDRSISVAGTWLQAHNTYLELFQGLGLPIGALLIGSLSIVVWRCVTNARRRPRDLTITTIGVGTTAIVGAHALLDFSLQIQAVTLTFTALLAAGLAQAESSRVVMDD